MYQSIHVYNEFLGFREIILTFKNILNLLILFIPLSSHYAIKNIFATMVTFSRSASPLETSTKHDLHPLTKHC